MAKESGEQIKAPLKPDEAIGFLESIYFDRICMGIPNNSPGQQAIKLAIESLKQSSREQIRQQVLGEIGGVLELHEYYDGCDHGCETKDKCLSGVGWRNCNYRLWQQFKRGE